MIFLISQSGIPGKFMITNFDNLKFVLQDDIRWPLAQKVFFVTLKFLEDDILKVSLISGNEDVDILEGEIKKYLDDNMLTFSDVVIKNHNFNW